MNEIANLIVATALGVGVPAVVAALWRVGTKVEVLAAKLGEHERRIGRLEKGEADVR